MKIGFHLKPILAGLIVLTLAYPVNAGNWVVNENALGIIVSNTVTGESFRAVSSRAAKKQAKILNKVEDQKDDG